MVNGLRALASGVGRAGAGSDGHGAATAGSDGLVFAARAPESLAVLDAQASAVGRHGRFVFPSLGGSEYSVRKTCENNPRFFYSCFYKSPS